MRRTWMLMLGVLLLSLPTGCRNGPISNAYYQTVDDINDHPKIYFDDVYYWYCRDCGCRKLVPFGNCY